jgi:hypothetical protein
MIGMPRREEVTSAPVGLGPCPHCGKAIAPGQTYMCNHCGGRFRLQSGHPTVAESQPSMRRDWRRLPRHPAFWFGAVGLPLMLAVGWLWLLGNWPCVPEDPTEWLCHGLTEIPYVLAMGLAFWYVAALAWDWPAGLAGPAAGAAAGAAAGVVLMGVAMFMGLPETNVLGAVGEVAVGSGMLAVVGLFAYPFGLLAGWAIMRKPLVGLVGGGLLLALAFVVIVTATPHYGLAGVAVFAPAMLLAGGGTLAVSAWLRLGGRQEVPASVPTADDRDDAGRRTS